MTKISVTGPKSKLETTIDSLHDIGLLHIEDYDGELETGEPQEGAEDLSELLVDIRSVVSKLPEQEYRDEEASVEEVQENFEEVRQDVDRLRSEIEASKRKISDLREDKKFYRVLKGSGVNLADVKDTESLEVAVADLDLDGFRDNVDTGRYDIFTGKRASAVVYEKEVSSEVNSAAQEHSSKVFSLPEELREGLPEEALRGIDSEIDEIRSDRENREERLEAIADDWLGKLNHVEGFLTERIEKAEAPLRFATTNRAFIAEGWVPSEEYSVLEERVADAADGKVHIQREEGGEAPVKHDNPRPVQPFESLTDLMAVPKYNEIDPSTVIFLTFPLFFGFMIGDFGYGLTTLAVFYAGYRIFEGAQEIFKSLMYASFATMAFGLAFGDAFGFIIFGEHSILAQQFGLHFFSQVPILFPRAEELGQVFTVSALIGFLHVNAGYLIGAYNEYSRHGMKEALLEKGSWLLLEIGVGLWYFIGMTAGLPIMLVSVVTLYIGEGVAGVVEIPSLLSNVLSYLRLFGVSVAAVALAGVVNGIADTAFATGGLLGIAGGVLILMLGHTFNTFVKIIEGFLQGIRLHYVEMFQKFYEGGGKKYAPFGAEGSQ
ncbi:MAG: V-type ATP synthase subunit I [Candidatus Nanohalobium sp.]